MPTPAASATADTGAPGSATNTSRAASRMTWSLRAAWARRPLRGAGSEVTGMGAVYPSLNGTFRSEKGLNGMLCSITVRNRAIHSVQEDDP